MTRVVVVGGGFGGLAAARSLSRRPVDLVLVDRQNHHLFQPLLYQVATAVLSPEDVATPIRSLLRGPRVRVVMDEAVRVDRLGHTLFLRDGAPLAYDALILAPGAETSYPNHTGWQATGLGLKSLQDALVIRSRVLAAFEAAEQSTDPVARQVLLTFVVIGGGPTGVELAGALAEIAGLTLRRDFQQIRPAEARVVLIESGPQLLANFPPRLSRYALDTLQQIGVTVHLASPVDDVSDRGVLVQGSWLPSRTVLWAAGIRPSRLLTDLGVAPDRSGRVAVASDLSLNGEGDVYVVGDAARVDVGNHALPALASVAMQEGRTAAENTWRRLEGQPPAAFRYRDKGTLATVGRSRAVAILGRQVVTGRSAWLLWLVVHILYLATLQSRLVVLVRWGWAYIVYQRGARLIYQPGRDPAPVPGDPPPPPIS